MTVRVTAPTEACVRYVFKNMREGNRREFSAVGWRDEPPSHILETVLERPEFFYVLGREKPICVVGGFEAHPRMWGMMMFATDDIRQIGFYLAKFCKNVMMRQVFDLGANRMQCISPEWFTEAHRWLEFLGFRKESEMSMYGKDGETYFRFAVTRDRYVLGR